MLHVSQPVSRLSGGERERSEDHLGNLFDVMEPIHEVAHVRAMESEAQSIPRHEEPYETEHG